MVASASGATPKVSVLVPAHDVMDYLDECVESILAQSFGDFELLLYDDGSIDATGPMCDAWAARDARIRVEHVNACDLATMRNILLADARGEYAAFIDADDFVEVDYLEYLVGLLESHPERGAAACAHWIDDHGKLSIDAHCPGDVADLDLDAAFESLLYHGVVNCCCWAKMMRRSVFSVLDYPEGELYEDSWRISELLEASGGIVFGAKPCYHYRKRRGSITAGGYMAHRLAYIDAIEHIAERALACNPALAVACTRRRAHARLSVLRTMRRVSGKDLAVRDELRDSALACKDEVLSDPRAPLRDKAGLRLLSLGYGPFFASWSAYEALRPLLAPVVGG